MIGYIYQIVNNENQQRYVGKTIDVQRRKREHFESLKQNKHTNKKLQNAWNIYGEDAFSFTYQKYEIENEDELNNLEINTIREYDSYTNGYNLTAGVTVAIQEELFPLRIIVLFIQAVNGKD